MNQSETLAVLEWLREYLKWASSKIYIPTTIFKMKRDLSEHKTEIYQAFREAVRDEFADFADIIGKALGVSEGDGEASGEVDTGGENGGGSRSTKGSEDRDNETSGGDEGGVPEEDKREDRQDNGEADNVSSNEGVENG